MQPKHTAQVDPSQRPGRDAHPSPRRPTRGRPLWRATFAGLLAAQLATLVGCGTLGGLPSGAPLGQTAPATAAAPVADLSLTRASASSPHRQRPTDLHAAITPVVNQTFPPVAATNRAPVVPAAFLKRAAGAAGGQVCEVGADCNACTTAWAANDAAGPNRTDAYRNAQEYIFDGGDQQPTVIVKEDWTTAGVDPTDTVIYYETLAGSMCVQPSNRVPIYAPRFGAVRQVSGLQLAMRAMGTERMLAPVGVERFDETNLANTVVQPVAPQGEQQVGLIDAFQENYVAPPMEQVLPLYRMSSARIPFELMDPTRTGLITLKERVDVQEFIQNAQTWVNPESLAVEISNQAAILLKDTVAAQELFVYELPDGCTMRIFKAASHTIANSGDIVSFTIRFDNAGVKPLGNAVIVDSLSPRLTYIQGSQQCSVGVRFSAEPNEVGSMVLRWEIEEPIEPTQGGVISFDCRVR